MGSSSASVKIRISINFFLVVSHADQTFYLKYFSRLITPHECRLRNMTYSVPVTVDIKNECPCDYGGCFIVFGNEKVIVIQEQMLKIRMIVELDRKGNMSSQVMSSTHGTKTLTNVTMNKGKYYLKQHSFQNLRLTFISFEHFKDIPVVIVFKAMEILADKELVLMMCARASIFTQQKIFGQQAIFGELKKKTPVEEAREMLATAVLVHVPVTKAIYLALMIHRVIQAENDPTSIDRDYNENNRMELAGSLLSLLFKDLFKRINFELKVKADKNIPKVKAVQFEALKHIRTDHITLGLENAIATVLLKFLLVCYSKSVALQGVTQMLCRLSLISRLGMMIQVNSQFEKTRVLCPSDTPEGEGCGLVKNIALMTHITTEAEEEPSFGLQKTWKLKMFIYSVAKRDQRPEYIHFNILGLVQNYQCLNRYFKLAPVYISCNRGRLCRPYIIVRNGKSALIVRHMQELADGFRTFEDFIHEGLIEYLDVNEENDGNTAPVTLLGVCAGLIPYPHHNQSPRNTYQCAMGKQAMGTIACNQRNRIDSLLYNLLFVPSLFFHIFPLGYGWCLVYKNAKCVLKRYNNRSSDRKPTWKHKSIDMDGFACVSPPVLINKIMPTVPVVTVAPGAPAKAPMPEYRDVPITKLCFLLMPKRKRNIIKIQLRHTWRPEIGDKFSSQHGQKGVTYVIKNPYGFPSRMTVGKLIWLEKPGSWKENFTTSSHLADQRYDDEEWIVHGYNYQSKGCFTFGTTGEQLTTYFHFGPVYYQMLKHMVHARSHGSRAILTQKPTEGRVCDGGLSLGETERDCLFAYGSSMLILERLMFSSGAFEVDVCNQCGLVGMQSLDHPTVTPDGTPTPASFSLQEFQSLNIAPQIQNSVNISTFKELNSIAQP
ncbi:hypothetical protein GHT06_017223 [Daphnia sinensis]|uniref:DNA-directed RNA polymerase subunit beta n=1 Tax=Daphnia sinensis TaxID=1820382 RepID=A0AAD5L742_9CRUS|nr:hypothetical protein GHT06_017223 [Daphnia sinensis]